MKVFIKSRPVRDWPSASREPLAAFPAKIERRESIFHHFCFLTRNSCRFHNVQQILTLETFLRIAGAGDADPELLPREPGALRAAAGDADLRVLHNRGQPDIFTSKWRICSQKEHKPRRLHTDSKTIQNARVFRRLCLKHVDGGFGSVVGDLRRGVRCLGQGGGKSQGFLELTTFRDCR